MSQEMGELDYGPGEALYFGADYLPAREDCAVEFHLLDMPAGRDEEDRPPPPAASAGR